jgi:hypothetical protein
VARAAWLTYRGAVTTAERQRDSAQPQLNVPSTDSFNQLNQNLLDLSNALRGFEGAQ